MEIPSNPLVEAAVNRLIDNLEHVDDFNYLSDEDYGYFGSGESSATVARLRLDWELSREFVQELHDSEKHEDIFRLMGAQISVDLNDLVENGDVNKINDPLLKMFDGSKKRGKPPVLVDIFAANLHFNYHKVKDTTEYTLYILMAVRWE